MIYYESLSSACLNFAIFTAIFTIPLRKHVSFDKSEANSYIYGLWCGINTIKSPNEIRLCVDMPDANRAILMTRHISPTIDVLTADLNGATAFSKFDLKVDLKVEFAEGSRAIEVCCELIDSWADVSRQQDGTIRVSHVNAESYFIWTLGFGWGNNSGHPFGRT